MMLGMAMPRTLVFVMRQLVIVVGAVVGYFSVRGLTEGDVATAEKNAEAVLELERAIGIAWETTVQTGVLAADWSVTFANWVYIWGHWPVLVATLIWLIRVDRGQYFELRNAMIISGVIGLVIFATFPVAPPRLYGVEFIDTVTERSHSYRVLQPPSFVNAYAAVPSLHFGWNLLVGITWMRVGRHRVWRLAGILMPMAMAWAVVATANHWVLDVVAGGVIALTGVVIERRRWLRSKQRADRAAREERTGHVDQAEEGTDRRTKGSGPEAEDPLEWATTERSATMQATVGDRITVQGHKVGEHERHGEIIEVRGDDGSPPYVVRWDDDGHESLFFPGNDAWVKHYDQQS